VPVASCHGALAHGRMVIAASAIFGAERRQDCFRHSHDPSFLRDHAPAHNRDGAVGSLLLHEGTVYGLRNLTLFFPDELYHDWLRGRAAAAEVAVAGGYRRCLRGLALRNFHSFHLRRDERDVSNAIATPISLASEVSRGLRTQVSTVRTNSYHPPFTRTTLVYQVDALN